MVAQHRFWFGTAACALAVAAAPASAQSARDLLTQASFGDTAKDAAMARVVAAQRAAGTALQHNPADREAALMQATALGYRAKLTGSRSDAVAARRQMEALVAREPRDAERHLVLGAWHMGAVHKLGGLMARAALGAQKNVGVASLDRAVALGGGRSFVLGLAALLRLEIDPADPRGRQLAEAAARGATPTQLDHIMQRAATAVLVPLRAGNARATAELADRLLPFGQIKGL